MRFAMAQRKAKKLQAVKEQYARQHIKVHSMPVPSRPTHGSPADEPSLPRYPRTQRPAVGRLEADDAASAISDASSCMLIKKRARRAPTKPKASTFARPRALPRERGTPAKAKAIVEAQHAAVSDDDSEGADNLFQ